MDAREIAKTLRIELPKFEAHLRHGDIQQLKYRGMEYLRFREKLGNLESGSVVFLNPFQPINSFSKIRRAIILEAALKRHFTEFYLEEKLDGYNIRIAKIGGRLLAISRGGLVCPYSTDFVNNQKEIPHFFKENDLVLCCELVGSESPYSAHEYKEAGNLGYFVFDIHRKGTGKPLPVEERQKLCRKYHLNQVRNLGYFKNPDTKKIWQILKKLESEGREGIVIKSPDMKTQMKYTLSNGNIGEIDFAFQFPFDSGIEFFFRRFIREAFQSFELKEGDEATRKRAEKLGLAILAPLKRNIEMVSLDQEMTQDSEIEGDPATLREFVKHLKNLGVKFDYEIKGNTLRIKRVHQASHDKIRNYLKGEFASD